MGEKDKKDKKRKEKDDNDPEKEARKKLKKEEKAKKKEANEGGGGAPKPAGGGEARGPPPKIPGKLSAQKKLKAWQDDELEAESGDEADEKKLRLQQLRRVAAQSLGQGAADASGGQEEPDTLDAYMSDISKVQQEQRKQKSEKDPSADNDMPQGMGSGVSVMDTSSVKTISLEEIMGLMSGGASSSSTAPAESAKDEKKEDSKDEKKEPDAGGEEPDSDQEAAFHAAFMTQMRKLRGGGKAIDIEDGSDTGEEWDEARTEREKQRQLRREERWRKQDEKAERKKERLAREAETGVKESSSEDSDEEVAAQGNKPLTKKEKRQKRREQKQKEAEEKEAADKKEKDEKNQKAKPEGMEDEERLESDPEASEDSEMEKPQESYFDLVKKYVTKKTLPEVNHSTIDYKKFQKNLYIQVKEITAMKDHEVDDFRRTNGDIRIRGKNCPRPIKSFLQCGLPERVLKILEKRECSAPFPIQMQAIPALMCGRDIIGVAQTGSGKTLAYLLPLIRQALIQMPTRKSDDGPVGFIVAPTRELALQIQRECNVFCKAAGMTSVCAFGGGPMGEQLAALKKGCEILVGTPGRLIDVLTTSNGKITNLRHVTFLVLDEADRMFDMGFEPQIGMFLQATRPDKQVAMLSATLPTHVEALARQCLKKPIEITVGERNTAALNVTQYVEVIEENQKFYRLLQLLGEWHDHGSVIVFVHQQKDVDEMFTELLKFGHPALALHGGQDQHDRDFTLQDFKDGVANILVATSVAARGLDVKKVILVVNFKVPDHLEDYIHRIGRTGRAGKPGFAFTFVQPDEGDRAQDMVDALRQCGQPVPEKLKRLTEEYQSQINRGEATKKRKWGGFGGKSYKFDNTEQSRQQKDRVKAKKDDMIGDEFHSEDEEEFKDSWNEDKPLSAAAAAAKDKEKSKGEGKGKGKDEEPAAKPAEVAKTGAEKAAQIAEKLKAEEEAKRKEKLGEAMAGTPAADAPQMANGQQLHAPKAVDGAKGRVGGPRVKTDEDLDAEAQAKAEEVLKNLPDEMREEKLPKLKASIKAKLVKANEAAAQTAAPGPPQPPAAPPPPEEPAEENKELSKITAMVPKVLGAGAGAADNMVARSIQAMQDGISSSGTRAAALAEARAAELKSQASSMVMPGMHQDELEINDYPQIVRQKAAHREPLLNIEEMTGAKVWVRGQYFASSAKVPEGARKLYVEITGPTAMAVSKAKYEVHKMVEALAIRTLNIPGMSRAVMGTPGRYDPAAGK